MAKLKTKNSYSILHNSYFQVGFTLIELLVSMSIMIILTFVGVSKYKDFNEREKLRQAARDVKTALQEAQKRAQVGEMSESACYGEWFQGWVFEMPTSTSYRIHGLCESTSRWEFSHKTFPSLPEDVSFTYPPLPYEIVFKPLGLGVELAVDYLPITLTSGDQSSTLVVYKSGEIELATDPVAPPPPPPPAASSTIISYGPDGCTACCGTGGWAEGCPPRQAEPLSCHNDISFTLPAGKSRFTLQNWQYRMLISHGGGKTQIDTVKVKKDGTTVWSTNPYWCPTSGGSPCCIWDNDSGWLTGGSFGPYSASAGSSHTVRIECDGSGADGWEGFRCEQKFEVLFE